MKKTINEITGFESNSNPVEILDANFKSFYFLENKNKERVTFNLPEGKYIFNCDAKELKKPLRYEAPELPKKEKFVETAETIEISVTDNPNKASFKHWTGEMFIDFSIWEKSIPFRRFVMGHELGHTFYFTEWKCDVFSAHSMLSQGYNPSQCFYANYYCLSDAQKERKQKLYDWLKQVKCYE